MPKWSSGRSFLSQKQVFCREPSPIFVWDARGQIPGPVYIAAKSRLKHTPPTWEMKWPGYFLSTKNWKCQNCSLPRKTNLPDSGNKKSQTFEKSFLSFKCFPLQKKQKHHKRLLQHHTLLPTTKNKHKFPPPLNSHFSPGKKKKKHVKKKHISTTQFLKVPHPRYTNIQRTVGFAIKWALLGKAHFFLSKPPGKGRILFCPIYVSRNLMMSQTEFQDF